MSEKNSKESSLTTPEDRNLDNKWKPDLKTRLLNEEEVEIAMSELNNTDFVEKFPRVDRTYADPAINLQTYGLISFVPAKGATPNENGVFGFAKLRGNFASEMESNQRAEYLIRNVDSYHQIYHVYVGRPFPITSSSKYSAEVSEIDIRKEMTKTISENVKSKRDEEQQAMKEIKDREDKLIEESKRDEVDPYDEYITLKVKKAQLSWTYLEHDKKMKEIKDIIIKTRQQLVDMDEKYPEYQTTYFEKYMKAREDAGLKESKQDVEANFIKYLVEEAVLPGIDN
jgi:hypothetical protein